MSTTRGARGTTETERIVAVACGGPTTTAAWLVSSARSELVRSSTSSISPWRWSKKEDTWVRWVGPRIPGSARWSTKKR